METEGNGASVATTLNWLKMVQVPAGSGATLLGCSSDAAGIDSMNPQDCLIRGLKARIGFLQRALETAQATAPPTVPPSELEENLSKQRCLTEELRHALLKTEEDSVKLAQALEQKSMAFEDLFKENTQLRASLRKRVRLDAIAHWWPDDADASNEDAELLADRGGCSQSSSPNPSALLGSFGKRHLEDESPLGTSSSKGPLEKLESAGPTSPAGVVGEPEPESGRGSASPSFARSPLALDLSPFGRKTPPSQRARGRYDYMSSYCTSGFDDTQRSLSSDAEMLEAELAGDRETRRSQLLNNKGVPSSVLPRLDYEKEEPPALLLDTISADQILGGFQPPRSPSRRSPGHTRISEAEDFPPTPVAASQGYAADWLDAAEVWLGPGSSSACVSPSKRTPNGVRFPDSAFSVTVPHPVGPERRFGNLNALDPWGIGAGAGTSPARGADDPEEGFLETDTREGATPADPHEIPDFYRRRCSTLTMEVNELSAKYNTVRPLAFAYARRNVGHAPEGHRNSLIDDVESE